MNHMRDTALRMLTGNILPFWQGLRDDEHGGFYGYMDIDLNLGKQAVKGCILNSRILWFFSEAARVLRRSDLLPYARHAYRFLVDRCLDREGGGVYWSVTHDGQPSDTTKHTYNQAFAVYALSAYHEASGEADALALAEELFALIERKCAAPDGYGEAFDRRFNPAGNEKLSENGVNAERTMNTLLHVFEAYSGLYRAAKSPAVAEKMRNILSIFENKIYNPALQRQEVFFDARWNSLIDLTSYGHDIEASWLVEWGCALLGDAALLERIQAICSALAENVRKRAFRENSLRNECERGAEDEARIWWVQAEAVVGFLNMAQKHPGNPEYREAAETILRFIEEKIVDKRAGSEWLSEVNPDGSHTAKRKPVVEPWKCPYHNGRMCLELLRREAYERAR
ncbi:MAG: AGE family epimerase/isomerase [Oscillospiraceae bacterium]|jgi:mannobiose 2-epimerase|nr:AGE family epimerase/isomerase [Oscillospiraceae bacterium]